MRIAAVTTALVAAFSLMSAPVFAGVTGYVNNPTTNSTDFAAGVSGLGGTLDTNPNFDTHPTGPLINTFYTASDGLTFVPTGAVGNVTNGPGPGDGNTSTTPTSPGEGLHPVSNYLAFGLGGSTLTLNFSAPVLGVGFYTIDLFNPSSINGGANPVSIQAFTGLNGTGTSLGTFSAAGFNFQNNKLYFMGVVDSANEIQSVVFTDPGTVGDDIGLDNIRIARAAAAVPEPSSLLMGSILGLAGLAFGAMKARARRRLAA